MQKAMKIKKERKERNVKDRLRGKDEERRIELWRRRGEIGGDGW